MWVKIRVMASEDQNERNGSVNSAIFRAVQLRKYYEEEDLKSKNEYARSRAISRKLKILLKQVYKLV